MANLKEIRNRISSVGSTMQITSAMKMVSAAKLKRAQDAITQMRPYASKLKEINYSPIILSRNDNELKNISQEQLDEGILGIISSIDKPLSPFGEAMSDFSMNLDRKNIKKRLEIRAKVKACTIDDLINVSQKYLFNESKKSVIAGENYIEEMKGLNFKIKNI